MSSRRPITLPVQLVLLLSGSCALIVRSMWEALDLIRRTLLTGWVLLLVSENESYIRLVIAVLSSLVFLIALVLVRPYRRHLDNALAIMTQLCTTLFFMSACWTRLYGELDADHPGNGQNYLGFRSLDGLSVFLMAVLTVSLSAVLLVILVEWANLAKRAYYEDKWTMLGNANIPYTKFSSRKTFATFLVSRPANDDSDLHVHALRLLLPHSCS